MYQCSFSDTMHRNERSVLFAEIRDTYSKASSPAYFGSHKDRSSQTFDNRLADTQSKTGSLCKVVHLIESFDEKLRRTQAIANLLFLFCGMPFADLAHLEKSNLEGNILKYNRIKTGTPMSIEILESASCIVSRLRNTHSAVLPEHPDYLFYILSGKNKRDDEAAYIEYQSTLRRFNNDLKSLAKKLRIHSSVTSYTFRHSWATTAKYRGVPIEMISESLGHKSIKTTQIYLKGFELNERTKVNRLNYSYVRNYRGIL